MSTVQRCIWYISYIVNSAHPTTGLSIIHLGTDRFNPDKEIWKETESQINEYDASAALLWSLTPIKFLRDSIKQNIKRNRVKRIQCPSCWWINSIKEIGNWVESQIKECLSCLTQLIWSIQPNKLQIGKCNDPAALCWSPSQWFDSMLFDSIKQTKWVKSHLGESNASSALC